MFGVWVQFKSSKQHEKVWWIIDRVVEDLAHSLRVAIRRNVNS